MITIDNLLETDLIEAGAVLDAAFGRAGMIAGLRLAYALQAESWFCTRGGAQMLAVVGGHDYGPFASIGMMAVHPSAQRQGLGERLMAHLIGYFEARGRRLLFLDASAAGRHLYPKLGFEPEGETLRLTRVDNTAALADPANTVHALGADEVSEAAAFDAGIFGANRVEVIRAYREGSLDRSFIVRGDNGRVEGYLIAGSNHIGPWVGSSPAAAEALLRTALALPFDRPPFVTCPAANAHALALLARCGFVVTERLLHMRRGGTHDPRQPEYIYGQASLTLG